MFGCARISISLDVLGRGVGCFFCFVLGPHGNWRLPLVGYSFFFFSNISAPSWDLCQGMDDSGWAFKRVESSL